jgi:acyl carrier protein
MQRAQVLELLRNKAVELLELEPDQLGEDVAFASDLHVDSLALVEFTMAIEDALAISLPEKDVVDVETLGQFADLVVRKTA